MGRQKSNSLSLPPDFVHVEKILTSANVLKLQTLSTSQHLKIYFINPVESLDVFFLVNYLFSLGLGRQFQQRLEAFRDTYHRNA